jgi:raffinose synthase
MHHPSSEHFTDSVSDGPHVGHFVRPGAEAIAAGVLPGFTLPDLRRFLALFRRYTTWLIPVYGTETSALPAEIQFLLWEKTGGRIGLALPLVHQDRRAFLRGDGDSVSLVIENAFLPAPAADDYLGLFLAEGDDPIALTRWAVRQVAARIQTFALRDTKQVPKFYDLFGWCTWDAFYGEVSSEKVFTGLDSWQAAGIPVPWLILDDGWQETEAGRMKSFGAFAHKFPGGLAPLIARAKREYGVRHFAAWHAQQGHWNGVDPDTEIGRRYTTVTSNNVDPRSYNAETHQKSTVRHLVEPSLAPALYTEWHHHLRAQGVDMVKVDNQSSMDMFCAGVLPTSATQAAYQRALQSASASEFSGELLQCMSHGSDVFFNLGPQASAMRNSFDFQPRMPERQQRHIAVNAANALLHHTVIWPDWDMFQSTHPAAGLHAAARAISGGPIYVSDKPGEHDIALLRKLCLPDGTILRCAEPALPTADLVFTDCYTEPVPLKLHNRNGSTGVLGLFHCLYQPDAPRDIEGSFRVSDIAGLDPAVTDYALYFHQADRAVRTTRDTAHAFTLPDHGWEIVTAAPVVHGIALFGLLDKLNGSRVISRTAWDAATRTFSAELTAGGRIGFHAARSPVSVHINGQPVTVTTPSDGLWAIETTTEPVTLSIKL